MDPGTLAFVSTHTGKRKLMVPTCRKPRLLGSRIAVQDECGIRESEVTVPGLRLKCHFYSELLEELYYRCWRTLKGYQDLRDSCWCGSNWHTSASNPMGKTKNVV